MAWQAVTDGVKARRGLSSRPRWPRRAEG